MVTKCRGPKQEGTRLVALSSLTSFVVCLEYFFVYICRADSGIGPRLLATVTIRVTNTASEIFGYFQVSPSTRELRDRRIRFLQLYALNIGVLHMKLSSHLYKWILAS
jgi:hypothetical protein